MGERVDTQKVFGRMKSRGLRVTLPRRAVIETLRDSDDYPSAEEIYMRIHERQPRIGLATVYRTLTMLSDMGIVNRFEFGEGKARYELADVESQGKHHHVIVCERCFNVVKYSDFTDHEKRTFEELEDQLQDTFDFEINRHVVQYYGVCSDCRN